MVSDEVLIKWENLIAACKAYYIDSLPTGMSDSEFDALEIRAAQEDGFFVRDYVFNTYAKGTRVSNSYIEKFKKFKVTEKTVFETMKDLEAEKGERFIYNLKYDGTSLALYLDPNTGKPKRIVTVGNLNLSNQGIDQTWKLINFVPTRFPRGIVAIQMEAVIDLTRMTDLDPEKARQKANGLINSKYCDAEINNLLTLRAYRYYTDNSSDGLKIASKSYVDVLNSFPTVISPIDGHILFAPADCWTLEGLSKVQGYTETDKTVTSTGTFLNDGWVVYNERGICQGALKFSGAGENSELIKSKVQSIQWNSQVSKGKDSWSANVIIDPVTIKGCVVRKPSAGSVSKLIKKNITPGAEVSIILANSTIPMIGDVFSPGNGDYQWPICSCGYKMTEKDVFGSLLKCGNPFCKERSARMTNYLYSLNNILDIDLNKYLVIDRFK
jgi:NAD-dependent DNA ligase